MHYQFDKWQRRSWHTDKRYYIAEIEQDLFGTWICRRTYGGIGSNRGRIMINAAPDYQSAVGLMQGIEKRRQQRGYIAA